MLKKLFMGAFGIVINVVLYVLIIFGAVHAVKYAYHFSYVVFGNVAYNATDTEKIPVQITEGSSTSDVGDILEKHGVIENAKAFTIHTALSHYQGLIQPGDYELSPSMKMDEILVVICGQD
ncbi:MAG: endolytic transglycosylase MltG [Lachnospiraceae bacterium]|nr:endolytic transglycosylase MltG [Lachnospiraceae bacterium]